MVEQFQNNQVFPDEIAEVNDIEFTSVMTKLMVKWNIITSIVFGSIGLVLFVVDFFVSFIPWFAWLFFLGLAAFIMMMQRKAVKLMAYAIREKDILFKKGIIWRSLTTVPFNRIQHIDLKRGPFDRKYGMSALKIYTAGGSFGDLEIDGIPKDEAAKLKQLIIEKIQDL